jgi:hypothetical protein
MGKRQRSDSIPEAVRRRTKRRIQDYAEAHHAGRYTRLEIRFRGQFCYIDAYTEPMLPSPDWLVAAWGVTPEEYLERLRKTPTHLCRLRYFGDEERWEFALFTYSRERYEEAVFPDGDFYGRPEDAFEASTMYLDGT